MEWHYVLQRVELGENDRTEFKHYLSDQAEIGKTLCAFADSDGGLLLLSIDVTSAIVAAGDDPEAI